MKKTNFATITTTLILLLIPTSIASGQSYANQVWTRLQTHYSVLSDRGDYKLRNYIVGVLNEGASDTWSFTFYGSSEYAITGACDNDCDDVDISLINQAGTVVKKDTQTDQNPLVFFDPPSNGVYKVKITMYSCDENPCYFGFGIFRK